MRKRTIALSVDPRKLMDFIEYLELKLRRGDYSYRYRSGKLYLTLYGSPDEIEEMERIARRAHRNFMMVHGKSAGGIRRYPREWVIEQCGGVPLSLLVSVLKSSGHRAELGEKFLVTDIEPGELTELIAGVREILLEVRGEIRQRKVREVIVTASFITGEPALLLLMKALEMGLIERVGEVLMFRASPQLVLEKLMGVSSEDDSKGEEDGT